jgi:HrpA-like RNA helicase
MEGSLVGYKMRFSDTTDRNTRIKVMTDGILLQELKADPLLRNYGVMLVDEAHERSLNIDFILGLLKGVLSQRADFKVIISSATINTNVFSQFFDSAPIISIDARIHPVEVFYMPQVHAGNSDEMMDQIVRIVVSRVKEKAGDILIFLPGEFEIKTCMQLLHTCEVKRHLVLYPLYGRLSKDEQERVFIPTPKDRTKVVVATNIAETSITIDGITTVIDSGMAKMNFYNQKDFTSSLVPLPVSKSSCEQRKGRAGRTAPGACYRLYSKHDFDTRFSYTTEEILRTDLSEVVLRMSDLGIFDFEKFPFITRPKAGAIASAEETLKFIKAIGKDRHLTSIGELMVRFPLLPRHSRVIVEGMLNYPDVIDEVLIAVAFLSTKTPFVLPPGEEDAAREAHKAFNTTEYGDFLFRRKGEILQTELSGHAEHDGNRACGRTACGNRQRAWFSVESRRIRARLPLLPRRRSAAVRLLQVEREHVQKSDCEPNIHPPWISLVSGTATIHYRRRNRPDQPDVRPVRQPAEERMA